MDLRLSRRGDYVLRAAIWLARVYPENRNCKVREIVDEMGIPRTFASQIVADLTRAGLATSKSGHDGGHRLIRDPTEISLLDLVVAADPSFGAAEAGPAVDTRSGSRAVNELMAQASDSLRAVLAATSLAQLVANDLALQEGRYPLPDHPHRIAAAKVAVSDLVQVELPLETIASRMRAETSWLSIAASAAQREVASGGDTRVSVGPSARSLLTKEVTLRMGRERADADGEVHIPLSWVATGPRGLFPHFEGEVVLRPIDPVRSELLMAGHYRPPLGRAGRAIDSAFLGRVARATVRSFLRRLARSLEDEALVDQKVPSAAPLPVSLSH